MFLPRCQEAGDLHQWRNHEHMLSSSAVTSLLMSKPQPRCGFGVNFASTNTKSYSDDSGSKGLENWQKRHPSQWSAVDVLDLIYFIAYACKEIDVSWVSGEHFQQVDGYKLCRMTKKEFVELEPRYGELLYDTVHELLERSNFTPPKLDDSSFTCEPIDFPTDSCRSATEVDNAIRLPTTATARAPFCEANPVANTATVGLRAIPATAAAAENIQLSTQIPKFVEELNEDDAFGIDAPNQRMSQRVSVVTSRGSFCHNDQGVLRNVLPGSLPLHAAAAAAGNELYSGAHGELRNMCGGYPCGINSQAEYRGDDTLCLSPPERVNAAAEPRFDESPMTSWQRQIDSSPAVYLDISAAHPTTTTTNGHVQHNSAPIDLRTGRQQPVALSQLRHQRHPDDSYEPSRLLPLCVPQSPTSLSDEGGPPEQSKRKLTGVAKRTIRKRPRVVKPKDAAEGPDDDKDDDDNVVGDVSGGGRHLWEFIRDLLRAGDRLRGGKGTITVPGAIPEGLPVELDLENIIRWENREEGVFRIIDSKQVAQLWGRRKHNNTMTYEKLSRALRWCRKNGFFDPLPKDGGYPKKLCFRFGPLANNWRGD